MVSSVRVNQGMAFMLCTFAVLLRIEGARGESLLRSFRYSVCTEKEQHIVGAVHEQEVTSLIECAEVCANHEACLSATLCEKYKGKTCMIYSSKFESCASLATNEKCVSFQAIQDPCQNGGSLDTVTMTCVCLEGWEGDRCQTEKTTAQDSMTTPTAVSTDMSVTTSSVEGCLSGVECESSGKTPYVSKGGTRYCCREGRVMDIKSAGGRVTCSCNHSPGTTPM